MDFSYGDLGVPGYVFELGNWFFEDCADFESTIFPDNLEALIYAAKIVRTPYLTPAGPEATGASASATVVRSFPSMTGVDMASVRPLPRACRAVARTGRHARRGNA